MTRRDDARRFVLLDRDGTIIVDQGYLSDPAGVEMIEGAAVALRRLADLGMGLAIVTNQSGVGRGLFDADSVVRVHERLTRLLESEGVFLDGIFVCPHAPDDGCACRKPGTELAERAAAELGFTPGESFVIGDKASDIGLGVALGATTILVRTGNGATTETQRHCRPDHIVDDLPHAADIIEGLL